MKYKRQFMGSLMAMALMVGGYASFELEEAMPYSKSAQYINQVSMKNSFSPVKQKDILSYKKSRFQTS